MATGSSDDRFTDPLSMDISRDLQRIDAVTTQILKDRGVWDDFIRDPNGVLIRLGLHPPTTAEISERANRAFYAILTNQPLIQLIQKHYAGFEPSRDSEFRETFDQGLQEGVIRYDVDFDMEGAYHLLDDEDVFREVLCLTLHDFNDKRILTRKYSVDELNRYVEQVIAAVRYRQPIRKFPPLELYDQNYGIGPAFFCSTLAECAAVATLGIGAEGVTAVTLIVDVGFWGYAATPPGGQNAPPRQSDAVVLTPVTVDAPVIGPQIGSRALAGDAAVVRKLNTLGRLAGLTGELLSYVHNFEQNNTRD